MNVPLTSTRALAAYRPREAAAPSAGSAATPSKFPSGSGSQEKWGGGGGPGHHTGESTALHVGGGRVSDAEVMQAYWKSTSRSPKAG